MNAVAAHAFTVIACSILFGWQQTRLRSVQELGNDLTATVSCGGHTASTCSECPQSGGKEWCNGDCVWFGGQCLSRPEVSERLHELKNSGQENEHNFESVLASAIATQEPAKASKQDVSCGAHAATSCELCPQGNGESWCHGECQWIHGACVSKMYNLQKDGASKDGTYPVCSASDVASEPNPIANGKRKFLDALELFKLGQRAALASGRVPQHGDDGVGLPLKDSYKHQVLLPDDCIRSSVDEDAAANRTAEKVKRAFLHAWQGYCRYAWGMDELRPLSLVGHNSFGGIGLTILDSLTSLWLLGLPDEFERAANFVASELVFGRVDKQVSIFELTIRAIGGLNGAHSLSGRRIFLDRSKELAERLLPAFDTPSGLPLARWNLKQGFGSTELWSSLAEVGSIQLEWRYISEHTGDARFKDAVDGAYEVLKSCGATGLMPMFLTHPSTSPASFVWSKFSFGGNTDSYYEYLLKLWVQNPLEASFKRMFLDLMGDLPLIVRPGISSNQTQRYAIIELSESGTPNWTMEHLACFAPGMIALALLTLPAEDIKGHLQQWTALAEGLTMSCVEMWTSTTSGLAPEAIRISAKPPHNVSAVPPSSKHSLLRPETVESLFYMHRLTGNKKYRTWGAEILEAILANAKVDSGFASVWDVTRTPTVKRDELNSFVFAETFKYLYLLFAPEAGLDLGAFVFNTEGHPVRRQSQLLSPRYQKV